MRKISDLSLEEQTLIQEYLSLFVDSILHGSGEHREWLLAARINFMNNLPVGEPRG